MATIKQIKASQKILENIGKDKPEPIGKILKDVGYSKNTADTPTLVTRSKGFMELLEKAGVTDDKLAKVLDEGLNASKAVVMGRESSESFVDIQPDYPVRHKYLETALRLKGHGSKDDLAKNNTFIQINNNKGAKYQDD